MDNSFQKELNKIFRGFKTLPYLFVGSGFSRRYLGLGNWSQLLQHYATILSFSDEPDDWKAKYLSYHTKAEQLEKEEKSSLSSENIEAPQLTFARMASLMERDFNTAWLNNRDFRLQHYDYKNAILEERQKNPFKCDIALKVSKKFNISALPSSLQQEINQLRQIHCKNIAGIITTNYDSLLETIFSDFTPFIGQDELLIRPTMGIAEIYKIHGCYSKPDSIIITHEDYQRFNDDCQYLAAKLLTIFLENPIIFLGYSIHDWNIQKILNAVVHCLPQKERETLQKRLFFIRRRHEDEQEDITIVNHPLPGNNQFLPMTSITLNSFGTLYEALANVHSRFMPHQLLRIKQEIYDLVLTQKETSDSIRVIGMDSCDKDARIEAVVGFGVLNEYGKVGLSTIKANEIYEDIVLDNLQNKFESITSENIVRFAMPELLKRNHMPLYKYIRDLPIESIPSSILDQIPKKYEDFFPARTNTLRLEKRNPFHSIQEILDNSEEAYKQIYKIAFLQENEISFEELERFLRGVFEDTTNVWEIYRDPYSSHLKRLIRLYDWMKYKK